jgi:hypothetical protein
MSATTPRPAEACPSLAYLHDRLYIDSEGEIRWRERPVLNRHDEAWNRLYANKVAGGLDKDGYRRVNLRCPDGKGRYFWVHHVVWTMHYGAWAECELDHRDGCRTRNVISNLRRATRAQNQANRGTFKANTLGVKGASWDAARGKWSAKIVKVGKRYQLGRFAKLEDAAEAYAQAAERLFGEYRRAA